MKETITPEEQYNTIARELASKNGDVKLSKMFGSPCLKVNGKVFASFHHSDMTFKLTGSAHAQALSLDGARLFDPGMGHTMKEWVQVPFAHAEQWGTLAERALEYVGKRGA